MSDQAASLAVKIDMAYQLYEKGDWSKTQVMLSVAEMIDNVHRLGPLRQLIEAYDNNDENSLAFAIGEAKKLIEE